ncbi:MAG: antibiotic biosynthesis monooxygenase family protein [Bacteroidota bacterium]
MKFKKDCIDDFLTIFETMHPKILAQEGCYSLQLVQAFDKQTFFTISTWEDEDALNKYRHSDFFKINWQKVKVLLDEKAEAWSTNTVFKS